MTFVLKAGHATCLSCGARIGNTRADKIEHLTTPSCAHADQKRRTRFPTTTETRQP